MNKPLTASILILCITTFVQAADEIDALLDTVELIPIMVNGDTHNRINIVLMNRWTSNEREPYNSPEMREEFIKDINDSLIAALTPGDDRAQTAYANYRAFFNVYGLWYPDTPAWSKGIDTKTVDALRDRLFLPWKDEHRGWVTFLVMPNRNGGGGGAARNLEKRVGTALIAGNGIGKMLHEIAHTCMSIGDEYTAGAIGTSAVPTYTVEKNYSRDTIKWRKWIEPDTPLPTPYTEAYRDRVGAFEGAQYHLIDYFRSTAQGCIMGAGVFDNTEAMCPICEQRVAMRVYTLVNPINSFTPSNTAINISGHTTLHFAMDHITPIPNTQRVRWILNGKTIASGVDEIDVELGGIAAYTLVCSLTDETPFIRPDPPYAKYPRHEIRWTISNSSPASKANPMTVSIDHSSLERDSVLRAAMAGGTPPYTCLWSNGHTGRTLTQAGPGLYDLSVVDSDFRQAQASYLHTGGDTAISETPPKRAGQTSDPIALDIDVTASDRHRDNGRIAISVKAGSGPLTFAWKDAKARYGQTHVYEAEDARITIPGHLAQSYSDASGNTFVDFNGQEGSVTWTVEVARSGRYPIDIVYGGISQKGTSMHVSVNGQSVDESLLFDPTRPLLTGWEKATVMSHLNEGTNQVTVQSIGRSGVNLDYIRVPDHVTLSAVVGPQRLNLPSGDYTVVVSDKTHSIEQTITVPEVYPFEITELAFEKTASGAVAVVDPLEGYAYDWYEKDAPLFKSDTHDAPLFTGTRFRPPAPGHYYVSAKSDLTHAKSSNRICVALDQTPDLAIRDDINPASLEDGRIKLWFDASDLDGDENKDGIGPKRGPLREWTARTWRHRGKIVAKYEPNRLNGMGVCAFDNVWVSSLGTEIEGFQTLVLVYRESSMTFPGKAPLRGLNKYIGKSTDSRKRLFDRDTVDSKTVQGSVFLNGAPVDPFNTPNPMTFCILTVQFDSQVTDRLSGIEGYWEGDIAEMLFIDGTLSDTERRGIEEYLRRKWFARIDLDF
ncbi:MAG: hypothetical protein GY809_16580 [Planctomycetes bacterium]|nr:hypothetical protein [Planctomycetota bacterium]